MKYILFLLLAAPFASVAQQAALPMAKPRLLEGFAQVGYVHELWIVSNPLSYGYSSLSYTGNGFYAGGGLRSRTDSTRPLGFGVSINYMQYSMDKTLNANEGVQHAYGFAQFTPMVYYTFKTRSRKLSFTARGDVGFMAAIKNNERGYVQFGLKGCVGYKAYEASLGFNFSQSGHTPAAGLDSHWREQMFTLGLACYPYRISGFRPSPKSKK